MAYSHGSNRLEEHNLSHEQRDESLQVSLQKLSDKINMRGNLPYVTVERQLELLHSLAEFDFGKFLIERRGGLNGLWTHYVITHPSKGRITGLNNEGVRFSEMEIFLLDRAPTGLATQQRFQIFQREIEKNVKEGCKFASVPSGLMADLLDLNYSHIANFSLYGIDLDSESLEKASELAKEKGLFEHCKFLCKDAWNLEMENQFDLMTSNGLNIYEADDQKVIELYRQLYRALKKGGTLVTSFLTPPPIPGMTTEWDLKKIQPQDALLQKIILADILACKWQIFRTEESVKHQLQTAGFDEIEVIYDEAHIFPTITAKKLAE